MIFHTVNVEMTKSDNAASARVILDYFVYQQQAAIEHYAGAKGTYEGAIAANERSHKVYDEEVSLGGFGRGFGHNDPYNTYQLEQLKKHMESAKKDMEDAKRLYMFIRERFVDKFVEPQVSSFTVNNNVDSPYWQENYVRLNRENK